ncbi:MAG: D-alanyl-D-alanine carboxypeptidase, partial [Hyphomicrobiales bacterium]
LLFDLLSKDKVKLDSRFSVSAHAAGQAPTKLNLKPGSSIRVVDAIRALVTKSANDAAVVVAENIGGSEENFARMMTAKAQDLGMTRTTFKNASGLPNKDQVTTARDMAILARAIMQDFPEYYGYFDTKYFSYAGNKYRNHNSLLFNYEGTDGIKTGYTRASGFNLMSSVRRKNKHLVGVVLGGTSSKWRDAHMRTLLTQAFPKASDRAPAPSTRPPLPNRKPDELLPPPAAPSVPAYTASMAPSSGAIRTRTAATMLASAPAADAAPAAAPVAARSRATNSAADGGYHIQIGAFSRHSDAEQVLSEVTARASEVVDGHSPIMVKFEDTKRELYRARFAGFSENSARTACSQLKARSIACVVMRAE